MPRVQLDVYSHNVRCTEFDGRTLQVLLSFCSRVARFDWVKNPAYNPHGPDRRKRIRKLVALYAVVNKERTEIRFHRHLYDDLLMHLKANGVYTKEITVIEHDVHPGKDATFEIIDGKTPRPGQIPKIEHLKREDLRSKLLVAQTGHGKTLMVSRAIAHRGKRVVMALTRVVYIDKWKQDLREIYGLKPGTLVTVQGAAQLKTLVDCAVYGDLDAKFIIISMKTLQKFFEDYENGVDCIAKYGTTPGELLQVLDAGVRLIDEVHEHFHTVFKLDLYTHVAETMNLTATMIDESEMVEKMMWLMFPAKTRPKPTPYDKYILGIAHFYNLSKESMKWLRWHQKGLGSYNHTRFEQSLLMRPKLLYRYLDMVHEIAIQEFVKRREGDQKLLIFSATVAMCDEVKKYMKKYQPHLDVRRYTSDDPFSTLEEADVISSTILSSGTAVDIPDLRTAILTPAVGSRRQNAQAVGRLRRMANYPETTPTFVWLVCYDIEEHLNYHDKKTELFKQLIREQRTERQGFII